MSNYCRPFKPLDLLEVYQLAKNYFNESPNFNENFKFDDEYFGTKLIELSKKYDLGYAVDVYPFYGSDASAALRAGHDIQAALIGPGVHASHGVERTHIDGCTNTMKLLHAYLTEIKF